MALVTSVTSSSLLRTALTLPVQVAVAATQATLQVGLLASPDGPIRRPGGYADLVQRVIGEGGYAQQLIELLTDENGPMRLAATVNDLTAPDRPLGRMLMRGGVLDRLLAPNGPVDRLLANDGALDRLLAEGGALDQLVSREGALDRLLMQGGALDRLTAPGGVLEQLLSPGGLADRIVTEDGFLEKLVAEGGTLDQLVQLGGTLEAIGPRLSELAEIIPSLASSADALSRAVGPLGELAGRLPLSRRKGVAQ